MLERHKLENQGCVLFLRVDDEMLQGFSSGQPLSKYLPYGGFSDWGTHYGLFIAGTYSCWMICGGTRA